MSTSRFTILRSLALVAASSLALACTDESPVSPARPSPAAAPSLNISTSSSSIDRLSIEVSSRESKQPLVFQMSPQDGKGAGLKLVAGTQPTVVISAHDLYGALTHRGTVELPYVELGENRPIELRLESVSGGEPVSVYLDILGQEPIGGGTIKMKMNTEVYEGSTIPLSAAIYDREGRRIDVDPRELDWAVSDPSAGRIIKDSRGRAVFASDKVLLKEIYVNVIWRELIGRQWIKGLFNPYVQLVAGKEFTCARRLNGSTSCWGANDSLQLGTTTTQTCGGVPCSNRPLLVSGNRGFSTIVAGAHFSCGLENGGALCWGANIHGQLGTGSTSAPVGSPVAVIGGNSFKSLAAGGIHVCGIRDNAASEAMCWGDNMYGALGGSDPGYFTLNPQFKAQPTTVVGGDAWKMLGMSEHTSCGVTTANVAKCWGYNGEGQGGWGWTGLIPTPYTLNTAMVPKFVATGAVADHMCWVDQGDLGWCHGMNDRGQLGVNMSGGYGSGYQIAPLHTYGSVKFAQITVGSNQTCGLDLTDALYCWGDNTDGKIGYDPAQRWYRVYPDRIGTYQFESLAAGKNHTCGITRNTNEIYCWGKNDRGQLGIGTTVSMTWTPTKIAP